MFFLCCTFSAVICRYDGDKAAFVEDIRQALYASKIVSYAQGSRCVRQVGAVRAHVCVCLDRRREDEN